MRLKTLADTLADCGIPQDDRAIFSNMIHGLNRKFDHAVTNLTYDETHLSSFIQARSYLLHEGSRLAHLTAHNSATALYAGRAPQALAHPAPAPTPPTPPQLASSGGNHSRKRRKAPTNGAPPGTASAPHPPASVPSPPFNPLTGTFQAWPVQPRPPGASVLGARPAYGLATSHYGAPAPYAVPLPYTTPSPYGMPYPAPPHYGAPAYGASPAPGPAPATSTGNPWDMSTLQQALLSMQQ